MSAALAGPGVAVTRYWPVTPALESWLIAWLSGVMVLLTDQASAPRMLVRVTMGVITGSTDLSRSVLLGGGEGATGGAGDGGSGHWIGAAEMVRALL